MPATQGIKVGRNASGSTNHTHTLNFCGIQPLYQQYSEYFQTVFETIIT